MRRPARDAFGGCACSPSTVAKTPVVQPWLQPNGETEAGPDTCAVIVAGGSGTRFGDPRGKQFVDLMGLPLVSWSILAFDHAPSVGHLVVVCPVGRACEMRDDVLSKLTLRCKVTLAEAGGTRQDSVRHGLEAAPVGYALTAIHDGARPLIQVEAIERCIAVVREDRQLAGAICASRETDTLKLVEGDLIVATADRSYYWCAQTPQVFRTPAIVRAHALAHRDGYEGTDDASLVEHVGGRVRVVETSRDNLKVTVPEDLAIARAALERSLEGDPGHDAGADPAYGG